MKGRAIVGGRELGRRVVVHAIAIVVSCGCLASALAQRPAPAQVPSAQDSGKAAAAPNWRAGIVQRAFASPEDAGRALIEAIDSDNGRAIYAVLGRGSGALIYTADPVQDKGMRAAIAAAYRIRAKFEMGGDGKATMLLGDNDYPFPYPLVKATAGWQFDAKSGAEEIVNRRIGANELAAINVCLAYVDAQREYVLRDRNNNGLLEYAQKLASAPGTQDGLYWATKDGEPPSPFGPLVAQARKQGYVKGPDEPYYGYYYKILTAQGKDAQGGAYDYIVDGKMIGGFALVAYPARWGVSGVMTFVCNHDGVVYEKNLGRETPAVAAKMAVYNPDATWTKSAQQ
jgi:hypothetical protein